MDIIKESLATHQLLSLHLKGLRMNTDRNQFAKSKQICKFMAQSSFRVAAITEEIYKHFLRLELDYVFTPNLF